MSEVFSSNWSSVSSLRHSSCLTQEDCDRAWTAAMKALEDCCKATMQAVASEATRFGTPMHESKFRPKSSPPIFVTTAGQHKHPEKHLPNLQLRQLRNVLARLRDIQQYCLRGLKHPQERLLYRKCRQVMILPDAPLAEQISFVNQSISRFHASQKTARIQAWKHKLLSCDKFTF